MQKKQKAIRSGSRPDKELVQSFISRIAATKKEFSPVRSQQQYSRNNSQVTAMRMSPSYQKSKQYYTKSSFTSQTGGNASSPRSKKASLKQQTTNKFINQNGSSGMSIGGFNMMTRSTLQNFMDNGSPPKTSVNSTPKKFDFNLNNRQSTTNNSGKKGSTILMKNNNNTGRPSTAKKDIFLRTETFTQNGPLRAESSIMPFKERTATLMTPSSTFNSFRASNGNEIQAVKNLEQLLDLLDDVDGLIKIGLKQYKVDIDQLDQEIQEMRNFQQANDNGNNLNDNTATVVEAVVDQNHHPVVKKPQTTDSACQYDLEIIPIKQQIVVEKPRISVELNLDKLKKPDQTKSKEVAPVVVAPPQKPKKSVLEICNLDTSSEEEETITSEESEQSLSDSESKNLNQAQVIDSQQQSLKLKDPVLTKNVSTQENVLTTKFTSLLEQPIKAAKYKSSRVNGSFKEQQIDINDDDEKSKTIMKKFSRRLTTVFNNRAVELLNVEQAQRRVLMISESTQTVWTNKEMKTKSESSQDNSAEIDLAFVFSSPLVIAFKEGESNPEKYNCIAQLDFSQEFNEIKDSIIRSEKQVKVHKTVGTIENFMDMLAKKPTALHFSGHGILNNKENLGKNFFLRRSHGHFLLFEQKDGQGRLFSQKELKETMLNYENHKFEFVFVATCHSEFAGKIFLEAGAKHVICVNSETTILDNAVIAFTHRFYGTVYQGYKICQAFEAAVREVQQLVPGDSFKRFKMLIYDKDALVNKNKKIEHQCSSYGHLKKGTMQKVHKKALLNFMPAENKNFIGRRTDTYRLCNKLCNNRLVTVIGMPGIGKSSVAKNALCFLKKRQFFNGGTIFLPLEGVYQTDTVRNMMFQKLMKKHQDIQKTQNTNYETNNEHQTYEKLKDFFKKDLKRYLVCFDSITELLQQDRKEFTKLMNNVLGVSKYITVLIITRVRLGHLKDVKEEIMLLGPMYSINASALFFDRAPREISDQEVLDLYEYEKNNPIGLDGSSVLTKRSNTVHKHQQELDTLAKQIGSQDNKQKLFSKLNLFKQMSGNPQNIIMIASLLQEDFRCKRRTLTLVGLSQQLNSEKIQKHVQGQDIEDKEFTSIRTCLEVTVQMLQDTYPESHKIFQFMGLLSAGLQGHEIQEAWPDVTHEHLTILSNCKVVTTEEISIVEEDDRQDFWQMQYIVPPSLRMYVHECISFDDKETYLQKISAFYCNKLGEIFQKMHTKEQKGKQINKENSDHFMNRHEANIWIIIKEVMDDAEREYQQQDSNRLETINSQNSTEFYKTSGIQSSSCIEMGGSSFARDIQIQHIDSLGEHDVKNFNLVTRKPSHKGRKEIDDYINIQSIQESQRSQQEETSNSLSRDESGFSGTESRTNSSEIDSDEQRDNVNLDFKKIKEPDTSKHSTLKLLDVSPNKTIAHKKRVSFSNTLEQSKALESLLIKSQADDSTGGISPLPRMDTKSKSNLASPRNKDSLTSNPPEIIYGKVSLGLKQLIVEESSSSSSASQESDPNDSMSEQQSDIDSCSERPEDCDDLDDGSSTSDDLHLTATSFNLTATKAVSTRLVASARQHRFTEQRKNSVAQKKHQENMGRSMSQVERKSKKEEKKVKKIELIEQMGKFIKRKTLNEIQRAQSQHLKRTRTDTQKQMIIATPTEMITYYVYVAYMLNHDIIGKKIINLDFTHLYNSNKTFEANIKRIHALFIERQYSQEEERKIPQLHQAIKLTKETIKIYQNLKEKNIHGSSIAEFQLATFYLKHKDQLCDQDDQESFYEEIIMHLKNARINFNKIQHHIGDHLCHKLLAQCYQNISNHQSERNKHQHEAEKLEIQSKTNLGKRENWTFIDRQELTYEESLLLEITNDNISRRLQDPELGFLANIMKEAEQKKSGSTKNRKGKKQIKKLYSSNDNSKRDAGDDFSKLAIQYQQKRR